MNNQYTEIRNLNKLNIKYFKLNIIQVIIMNVLNIISKFVTALLNIPMLSIKAKIIIAIFKKKNNTTIEL